MSIETNIDQGTAMATRVTFGEGDLHIGLGVKNKFPIIVIGNKSEKLEETEGGSFMTGDIVELHFKHPESIDIMIQQLLNAKAEINKVIRPIPKKGIIRKISKNRKNNRKHK